MNPLSRAEGRSPRKFAAWAPGAWVLLLLAAFGAVQYMRGAHFAYVAAALLVIVLCAGCILRQRWARPWLRGTCLLLALWALATGVLMLRQWDQFELARQQVIAQPELAQLGLWLVARAQRTWQVALALKALAIPLLLWLAWTLGRPEVRAQFRSRR